jgi:hypothetical protein
MGFAVDHKRKKEICFGWSSTSLILTRAVFFLPFISSIRYSRAAGGDGGMSPGTSWKPFSISEDEYAALVDVVLKTTRTKIEPHVRWPWLPKAIDHSFDHIQDRLEWFEAVCAKHRDSWHARLKSGRQLK